MKAYTTKIILACLIFTASSYFKVFTINFFEVHKYRVLLDTSNNQRAG